MSGWGLVRDDLFDAYWFLLVVYCLLLLLLVVGYLTFNYFGYGYGNSNSKILLFGVGNESL